MLPEGVGQLIELGTSAVYLFLLLQVWQRLNVVTDRLTNVLVELVKDRETAREERQAIAQAVGAINPERSREP